MLTLCLFALPIAAEPPISVRLDSVSYNDLASEVKGLKGKVVLVDVWGTFCPPCKEKFPQIIALHERYGKQGLVVITVSVDRPEDSATAKEFLVRQRATCRNVRLADDPQVWQSKWKADGVPLLFLFDRAGKLVQRWEGKVDAKDIEKQILAEMR
jgi:thiol-disulfide isomerase/thioredoxin